MPYKLLDPQTGRSPYYRVRGTEFGVYCDRSTENSRQAGSGADDAIRHLLEKALASPSRKTDKEFGMERAAWTPRQLAERWECSERHVRNLINRGELQFFRLGGKLVRIPHSGVEAFEQGGDGIQIPRRST